MKTLLLALALTLCATPAFAAPAITQEGAEALQKLAEAALTSQTTAYKNAGSTLISEGRMVVEPAGTYYALTTPQLSLKMPDGVTRSIGMLAINAIPTEDPDTYKMAIALPTPMMDKNASGQTIGQIDIGSQTMNGLYHFNLQNFSELMADYKNIRFASTTGPDYTIGSAAVQMTMDKAALETGKASGSFNATLQDIGTDDTTLATLLPKQVTARGLMTGVAATALNTPGGGSFLKKIFTAPGSRLVLQNTAIDGASYGVTANGDLNGAPGTANGVSGTLHLAVRGLEALTQNVMQAAATASPETQKTIQMVAPILLMMQMTGKVENGMRIYDLNLTPDGAFTLNGQPLGSVGNGSGTAPATKN